MRASTPQSSPDVFTRRYRIGYGPLLPKVDAVTRRAAKRDIGRIHMRVAGDYLVVTFARANPTAGKSRDAERAARAAYYADDADEQERWGRSLGGTALER